MPPYPISHVCPPEDQLAVFVTGRGVVEVDAKVEDTVEESMDLWFRHGRVETLSETIVAAGSHTEERYVQTSAAEGAVFHKRAFVH